MSRPDPGPNAPAVSQIEVLKGRLALVLSDGSVVEAGSKTFSGAIPVGIVVGLLTTQSTRPPNPNRLAELCFDAPFPVNWRASLSQSISRLKRNYGFPIEAGSWKLLLPPESVDLHAFEQNARRAVRHFVDNEDEEAVKLATKALDYWEMAPFSGLGAFPLVDGAFDPHLALHKRATTLRVKAMARLGRLEEAGEALQFALDVYPSDAAIRGLAVTLDKLEVAQAQQTPSKPAADQEPQRAGLPAPTYPRFVGRLDMVARLQEALGDHFPVIAVTGLGGSGKTALVRFFVEQQLDAARYSAVVWVTDRTRPGTTTLESVLTQISLALDAPALGRGDLPTRSKLALALLEQTSTLLVIDNYETVVDEALSAWLSDIPSESKAMLTSIWSPTSIRGPYTEVRLNEMTEQESKEFCALHQARAGYSSEYLSGTQRDRLISACFGNPRLIEWCISHLKWQTPEEVISLVQGTGVSEGSPDVVVQELLRQSLDRISPRSRRVLTAYAYFPYGARPAVIAGLMGIPAVEVAEAIEELVGHCLLDGDRGARSGRPSYIPEPLSRARVLAQSDEEEWRPYQDRWVRHHRTIAESVGFCPQEISRLVTLDDIQTRRNIEFAIQWALDRQACPDAVVVAREVRYWYYCRGVWSLDSCMNRAWYSLAVGCSLWSEAFDAAVYGLNIASKQAANASVEEWERRLQEVAEAGYRPSSQQVVDLRHARALELLAIGQYVSALEVWGQNLATDGLTEESYDANLRWYVQCLHRAGLEIDEFDLDATLKDRIQFSSVRGYLRAELMLRLVAAERMLSVDRAAAKRDLMELEGPVDLCNDAMYRAQHLWLLACATDEPAASEIFSRVAGQFAALGLDGRAAEARKRSRTGGENGPVPGDS